MEQSTSTSGPGAMKARRILCVDDEPMVLRSLTASLRKHFEVIPAAGPFAALELLEREVDICAVVSDYRMPGMDGGALLRRVRDQFPTVVRIMLSGAGATTDDLTKEPGLAFRILAKPCRREVLVATIEEALLLRAEMAQAAADP